MKLKIWILTLTLLTMLTSIVPAQSVCDLKFTASLGGCNNVYSNWFTKRTDSTSVTLTYLNLFTGQTTIVPLPGSARSYSLEGVDCGAHYDVTAVMSFSKSPTTCTANLHDNHNRPCDQCEAVTPTLAIVNAASYRGDVGPNGIGAAFSANDLTTETAYSFDADPNLPGIQLPTILANVRFFIDGSPTGLFFVSPRQINFYVPPGLTDGLHDVYASTPDGRTITGTMQVNRNSPGVFTIDASGAGQASCYWWVFRNGLPYNIYTIGTLNQHQFGAFDRLFLILFGTGINAGNATLRLGNGREYSSFYAGPQGILVGMSQVNIEVPVNQLWTGTLGASLTVFDPTGTWSGNGFLLRGL